MRIEEVIAAVEKINPQAAQYLQEEAPELKSWQPAALQNTSKPDMGLSVLFLWEESPQRRFFWSELFMDIRHAQSMKEVM